MEFISYGKQNISEDDINSVIQVLKSDFLTQGPVIPKFEESIRSYVDCGHAVAVNSATSALHIACLALGVGEGDIVWTTPITFVASANCARFCGADVDFVDIDPKTYNLCPKKLEDKLAAAKKAGKLPKVVIPVHLTGQPCEMDQIHALSVKYGFKIVEDASHAIGGKYKGEPIGNCKYSDVTVFSFHPVKIITSAEGGVATTNSDELAQKMRLFASHGVTRDENLMDREAEGPWYYQQVGLGFNYRMTEMQAALGLSQMKRLGEFVSKRHEIVEKYNELLAELPITLPYQMAGSYSAHHLYVIKVKNRTEVFKHLRAKNIGVNVHYIPVHTQPYYKNLGFEHGDFPNAEKYYDEAISIPLFPTLSNEQIRYIVDCLKEGVL